MIVGAVKLSRTDDVMFSHKLIVIILSTHFCLVWEDEILPYLLTPWSRVLLEKLTGFAANQEIPLHFMEP